MGQQGSHGFEALAKGTCGGSFEVGRGAGQFGGCWGAE